MPLKSTNKIIISTYFDKKDELIINKYKIVPSMIKMRVFKIRGLYQADI